MFAVVTRPALVLLKASILCSESDNTRNLIHEFHLSQYFRGRFMLFYSKEMAGRTDNDVQRRFLARRKLLQFTPHVFKLYVEL